MVGWGQGGGTGSVLGVTIDNLHSKCVSLTPMPLAIALVDRLRAETSSGVANGAWPAIIEAAQRNQGGAPIRVIAARAGARHLGKPVVGVAGLHITWTFC